MIHHVLFWLNDPGSASDRAALCAGLRALKDIPEIRSIHIGGPAATDSRDVVDSTYDVSELLVFDTIDDQKIYQDHPLHRAFVEEYGHLWRRVVVYDVETMA